MEMKTYIKESARTAAPGIHRDIFPTDFEFAHELLALDMAGASSDALKRQLFYNQDLFKTVEKHRARIQKTEAKLAGAKEKVTFDKIPNEVIHAALGIASEAGELFEEIVNAAAEGRELDAVNMKEEAGDIMWYLAMLMREFGLNFEDVGEANIDKLRVRFPEKFTKENTDNRDLDKEQEALSA